MASFDRVVDYRLQSTNISFQENKAALYLLFNKATAASEYEKLSIVDK